MKKLLLLTLLLISTQNIFSAEYIFKVSKHNFEVNNGSVPNNPDSSACNAQVINWLNCSGNVSQLENGQSLQLLNSNEEYIGSVDLICSNGVLSQSNALCEEVVDSINCDAIESVGQRGNSGECEDLLIVNDSMLRNMVSANEDYSSNNIYTGQVTNMSGLFNGKQVNYDITGWNTKNVTNMSQMFYASTSFNQPIGNWNMSKVTLITGMFRDAVSFNQPIGNWDISNVTGVNNLFYGATSFNQPIGNWNISKITRFFGTFQGAISFNQPLNNWNVSQVTHMTRLFSSATSFNQPLNNWNTSNVVDMQEMFIGAINFNQNISGWNVQNVMAVVNFKTNSGLTEENSPIFLY